MICIHFCCLHLCLMCHNVQLWHWNGNRWLVMPQCERSCQASSLAAVQPGYSVSSLPLPLPTGCQPWIVFWCFLRTTIELHSQQPKQTFVSSYASGHFFHPLPLIFLRILSLLCLPFVLALLHSLTSIEQEDMSGREPPTASGVTCDYHYL